jgi:serine/threonine-protein kinase HipA
MVFNVCIGNTDDHLRNHAAFWDGQRLALTPAYDLCPQPRSGQVASQALNITRVPGERASQLRLCRKAAPEFLLSGRDADQIIETVLEVISRDWGDAADEAQLTLAERGYLWQRQVLTPYIYYDQA